MEEGCRLQVGKRREAQAEGWRGSGDRSSEGSSGEVNETSQVAIPTFAYF
jgi:hypothetical protein